MRFFASMGTLAVASLSLGAHAGIIDINEVRTGSGNAEYIELKGPPGQSLAGFAIVIIGDGTSTTSGTGAPPTRSGVVEWLYRFAATDVIGPSGYLVLRNPGQNPANPADTSGAFPFTVAQGATDLRWGYTSSGLAADTQIESPDNQTYLLVQNYTGTDTFQTRAPNQGADGQDLDTNDDGILDITPWAAIIDGVVLKESSGSVPGSGQEWWYFPTTCGPYTTRQVVPATSGTIVAGWDFQTTTNANAGTAAAAQPNTPRLFRSNAGVGTMYLDGTNGSSSWAQATELNAFTGTSLNATGTGTGGNGLDPATTPTSSLALQAGGTGTPGNGKSFTLKFPMVGISGLNISYATRTSGATTGFTNHAWAWSTDGTSWTDIEAVTTFTTSFAVKTLAPLNALNGVADAYLRCTVTGATSTSSNNRFDNIVLLSNPVTNNTIVTSYLGPIHGYKTSTGAWAIGVASTTVGFLDTPGANNVDPAAYSCGATGSGDCSVAHDNPYCADSCCCTQVCVADPFCCQVRWDSICAAAAANCTGNCGGGCPTDLNADGATDGNDLGQLLSAWGPGTSPADFNQDGAVDGNDLGIMLGAWGPCSGG